MMARGLPTVALGAAAMLATAAIAQDRPPGSDSTGGIDSGIDTTGSVVGDRGTAGSAPGSVSGGSRIETRIPRYEGGLDGAFDSGSGSAVGPGAPSGGPSGSGPRGPEPPSILE